MNSFTRGGERKNNWMRFSMHLKSLSTDHATQPKNENVFSCCSEPMTFFSLAEPKRRNSFVFHRKRKYLQVWNNMWMSNW